MLAFLPLLSKSFRAGWAVFYRASGRFGCVVLDRIGGDEMEWQPIETMPRDDGSYLVADSVRGMVAPYIRGVIHNNAGSAWDWQYGEAITHWMPLPEPPAKT